MPQPRLLLLHAWLHVLTWLRWRTSGPGTVRQVVASATAAGPLRSTCSVATPPWILHVLMRPLKPCWENQGAQEQNVTVEQGWGGRGGKLQGAARHLLVLGIQQTARVYKAHCAVTVMGQ